MERLGDEVRRELGRFGPVEGDTAVLTRAWPLAVGETVARNAWPARLDRGGKLHVNTSSSTWAFELGRLAETILVQLRAELGETTPRALTVAPGGLPEPRPAQALPAPQSGREPTADERAAAAEIAAAIEDEELRRLVARAAAASLSREPETPSDDRRF